MPDKPCGLIPIIPPALQAEWAANLAEFLARFRPAALILRDPPAEHAMRIIRDAKPFELAVLFIDDVDGAMEAGTTGVYFSAPGAGLSKARSALGSASVLGVACGLSRHAAMESAEEGADFVAFDASNPSNQTEATEISSWWDDITGVPSALVLGAVLPDVSVLSKARPDFVMIEEADRAGESLTFATEFGLQSQT
jgi:thiamine-phosphate pyrophosphorylase